MKELSKTLTGKKIRDEMLKRKMTVRDLQDALEQDSPQSIYKWLRGESLPSLPNMLVLGELFKVPLERLLVHEDGSVAYHRIFDDSLPYEIAYLVQDKDDFPQKGGMWHGQIPSREPVTQESLICLRSVLTQKLLITDI